MKIVSFFRFFKLDNINIASYSRFIGLLLKSYAMMTTLGHVKVRDLTRALGQAEHRRLGR